jgi:hypothetical protein
MKTLYLKPLDRQEAVLLGHVGGQLEPTADAILLLRNYHTDQDYSVTICREAFSHRETNIFGVNNVVDVRELF